MNCFNNNIKMDYSVEDARILLNLTRITGCAAIKSHPT